jgi:hypothetical protein
MATTKKSARVTSRASEVDEFMRKLEHPFKAEMEAVRAIILGASPEISEGIKWNAPSFRVKEYFATINIRKDEVLIILHLGAKVKDNSTAGLKINDPTGLLEWLAKDRAAVKFHEMKAIKSRKAAFEKIVRQWIAYLA